MTGKDRLTHTRRPANPARSRPDGMVAVSHRLPGIVPRERLHAVLHDLGGHLLRMNGVVDFGEGPRLVERVFERFSDEPAPVRAARDPVLTVITHGLDKDDVARRLSALAGARP